VKKAVGYLIRNPEFQWAFKLNYNTSMPLTTAEVEHIARLARLALTKEEKERFRIQLSDILEYAARLQEVDTSHIPPTATVLPLRSVLRPDEPGPCMPLKLVLQNAPLTTDDQFRVAPVLDQNS
jgi:aspartyl-tRNA(Asn)/glutamyl-tRNA(Gln) amidotransferase subunit C